MLRFSSGFGRHYSTVMAGAGSLYGLVFGENTLVFMPNHSMAPPVVSVRSWSIARGLCAEARLVRSRSAPWRNADVFVSAGQHLVTVEQRGVGSVPWPRSNLNCGCSLWHPFFWECHVMMTPHVIWKLVVGSLIDTFSRVSVAVVQGVVSFALG